MEKSAPIAARRFNPLLKSDWDVLLVSRPDFSFFHSSAWLKVLAGSYGFEPQFISAGSAVLPLMATRSWLTGRRGIALPFTDECPPLGADPESLRALFAFAVEQGRAQGWKCIELRGGRNLFDPEVPASVTFFGHELDLTADETALFERQDSAVRRAIRKAEKSGVQIEISGELAAVKEFYRLQCLTRQRHGLPPQPWSFFVNIHQHILSQNSGAVVLARQAGRVIAASVYFHFCGRAIYKYGASDFAAQALRGSNLVMWHAMKWLAQRGITRLDLGKTALNNEGLRRFKLNLGAQERRVEYVKYDLRQNRFVVEPDGVTGWHNRVFSALPISVSRWIGELLYRHWA